VSVLGRVEDVDLLKQDALVQGLRGLGQDLEDDPRLGADEDHGVVLVGSGPGVHSQRGEPVPSHSHTVMVMLLFVHLRLLWNSQRGRGLPDAGLGEPGLVPIGRHRGVHEGVGLDELQRVVRELDRALQGGGRTETRTAPGSAEGKGQRSAGTSHAREEEQRALKWMNGGGGMETLNMHQQLSSINDSQGDELLTETQRHRDKDTRHKIHRHKTHRDTKTQRQRHRDTKTQRHKDTKTQRHRDTRHRDKDTRYRHKDTRTQRQRHRDTETKTQRQRHKIHRDTKTQRHRHRDTRHRDKDTRYRHKNTRTQRQRHRDTDTKTQRQRHKIHRDTKTETKTQDTQATETKTQRQKHRDTKTQRQRHKIHTQDRDKDTDTETQDTRHKTRDTRHTDTQTQDTETQRHRD